MSEQKEKALPEIMLVTGVLEMKPADFMEGMLTAYLKAHKNIGMPEMNKAYESAEKRFLAKRKQAALREIKETMRLYGGFTVEQLKGGCIKPSKPKKPKVVKGETK